MEFKFVLPEELNADNLNDLLEYEWLIPRKVRHFLRIKKNININGKEILFHQPVKTGDIVTLTFENDDYPSPIIKLGNADNIIPIWEDEHLIIVNKTYGKKTHPNEPDEANTLLNDLAAYLEPKNQLPYVVHRLDKDTSGAILFAKNPIVLPILSQLLEKKEIHRIYEALIEGSLPKKKLTINKKIGRDRHNRQKRIIDERNGKKAITHVSTLKNTSNNTWVTCSLETGRTHQIRVHLASIDHPIIGDPLYNSKAHSNQRLHLHARELNLTHPFTKEKINVRATPYLSEQGIN